MAVVDITGPGGATSRKKPPAPTLEMLWAERAMQTRKDDTEREAEELARKRVLESEQQATAGADSPLSMRPQYGPSPAGGAAPVFDQPGQPVQSAQAGQPGLPGRPGPQPVQSPPDRVLTPQEWAQQAYPQLDKVGRVFGGMIPRQVHEALLQGYQAYLSGEEQQRRGTETAQRGSASAAQMGLDERMVSLREREAGQMMVDRDASRAHEMQVRPRDLPNDPRGAYAMGLMFPEQFTDEQIDSLREIVEKRHPKDLKFVEELSEHAMRRVLEEMGVTPETASSEQLNQALLMGRAPATAIRRQDAESDGRQFKEKQYVDLVNEAIEYGSESGYYWLRIADRIKSLWQAGAIDDAQFERLARVLAENLPTMAALNNELRAGTITREQYDSMLQLLDPMTEQSSSKPAEPGGARRDRVDPALIPEAGPKPPARGRDPFVR